MKEVEIYNINNKEYILLNKVVNDVDTYLYFSNKNEEDDYLIRKLDSSKQYLVPLDDEDEVKKAIFILTNSIIEA